MERYGLMAVVPTLKALLLSSLNDLQFFLCVYTLFLSFRVQSIIGKCTSRHLFPYGGLCHAGSHSGLKIRFQQSDEINF